MPSSLSGGRKSRHKDVQLDDEVGIPHMQDVDDAAHRIGQTFPGRIPALAQRMGVNPDTLTKKLNPNCETHNLSVGDSVHLQMVAGRYDVLHAMAQQLEHVCIHVPDPDRGVVASRLAQVGAEVGDVFRVAGITLADGEVSATDRRKLTKEVVEAISALSALLKVL